jgi:hypothetical protein
MLGMELVLLVRSLFMGCVGLQPLLGVFLLSI